MGVLLLGAPRPAHAQNPTEQYLIQRKSSPFRPDLHVSMIAADPTRYRGLTFEIEGRLTGIVRAEDDGAIVCLSSNIDGPLTLKMSRVPVWLQPGANVRVLCFAVDPEPGRVVIGVPEMEVIAVASSSDLAAVEMRIAQQKASEQQRARASEAARAAAARVRVGPTSRGAVASRGGGNRGAITLGGANLSGLSPSASAVFPYYKAYIAKHNKRLTDTQASDITYAILRYSEALDMDPRLIVATIIAESDFRIAETSHAGAMGLIQLMPDEVERLRLSNPYDPIQNVAGGIYLLKERLNKYSGSPNFKDATMEHIILALASYNAGEGAVKKYHGVPPYRETRGYVKRIEKIYRELCAGD